MSKGLRWTLLTALVSAACVAALYNANRTYTCREMLDEQGYGRSLTGAVSGMLASRSESDLIVFDNDGTSHSTGIFKLRDDTGVVTMYYLLGETQLPYQNSVQMKVRFNTRRVILSQGGKPLPFFFATGIEELQMRDPG